MNCARSGSEKKTATPTTVPGKSTGPQGRQYKKRSGQGTRRNLRMRERATARIALTSDIDRGDSPAFKEFCCRRLQGQFALTLAACPSGLVAHLLEE